MPVLKRATVRVSGVPFTKVYNVDKRGVFWMKLPLAVATGLNVAEKIEANTLAGLDPQFDNLVKQWTESRTTSRRVIVYCFSATARIYKPRDKDHVDDPQDIHNRDTAERMAMWTEVELASNDISFTEGLALSLSAAVFEEFSVDLMDVRSRRRYEYRRSSIPYSLYTSRLNSGGVERDEDDNNPEGYVKEAQRMLAWSAEREKFFYCA